MVCTETVYIDSAISLKEKVDRIDTIIDALLLRMVDAAAGVADTDEYELDDGQVKIKTKYRNPNSIATAIQSFKRLREDYLNRLNGRVFCLRSTRGLS